MTTPSALALKLATIAQEEQTKFHLMDEADSDLCKQVKKYWKDIGFEFTSCVVSPELMLGKL